MCNNENVCVCSKCECQNGKACNCSDSCSCKMSNLEETMRGNAPMVVRTVLLIIAVLGLTLGSSINATAADRPLEFRLLATSKTSTMGKELNEAGAAGYRFSMAMGGE